MAEGENKYFRIDISFAEQLGKGANIPEQLEASRKAHPERFIQPEQLDWEILAQQVAKRDAGTAEKRAIRVREIRTNKNEMPQLWDLEGPTGVHTAMQKHPPNNPIVPTPIGQIVDQEKQDHRRVHPKPKRYGPKHDLTEAQYRLYLANRASSIGKMTKEEKINMLMKEPEAKQHR